MKRFGSSIGRKGNQTRPNPEPPIHQPQKGAEGAKINLRFSAPFALFCGQYHFASVIAALLFFLHCPLFTMRRLDQLLANLGYCSRREARAWIDDGRVTVRGQPADNVAQKAADADVLVDGQPLDHPDGLLLLLHKPLGLVCSHEEREGPNVYSLLPERWRRRNPAVTSIGRLDKDTSGLLLLTDQSPLVHRLTSPKHKVPKMYRATVDVDLVPKLIPTFASGTLLLAGEKDPCAPAELQIVSPREAEITLTEGRYHQVRRMFSAVGTTVLTLHRGRFGSLDLGDLSPGKWRELPLDFFDSTPRNPGTPSSD
jgi:16S rRNA pseudouridine516 synthase